MADKATPFTEQAVSSADIRSLCGDIPDWKVSSIAALLPTRGDIEVAVAWADHQDEACEGRVLEGKSAQIFDILTVDEEMDEEH
jgi:hypothetical protein